MRKSPSTTVTSTYEPPPPAPVSQRDAAFLQQWEHVRCECIEVHRAHEPIPLSVVRACVDLGRLLPPDAVVELKCENAQGEPALPTSVARRMWTERAYENGRFMFETHLPDTELAVANRLTVNVRPALGALAYEPGPELTRSATLPMTDIPVTQAPPVRDADRPPAKRKRRPPRAP